MCEQKDFQHFFLTRFNILLWQRDKEGTPVRTTQWLDHRFAIFENYCLPSIKNQTCQDFEWIVLFDSTTPERYKEKIAAYQKDCPQFIPVFVEPKKGRFFADIFREEIVKRLNAERVISTYLDNDDALNVKFVEDLRKRTAGVADGTFFYYDKGYQYYTDDKFMLQINYPRNHFVSVVEKGNPQNVKGIFGYGRHYYIAAIKGASIEHVKAEPMWCENVHGRNMLNDANFFIGTRMVSGRDHLRDRFAIDEEVDSGLGVYVTRFLPRYLKTFVRRAKRFLLGRKW